MGTEKQEGEHPSTVWKGASGNAWVEMQHVLDAMLAPFTPLVLDGALRAETHRVLDVGCGAGATTLAAARRLGADGSCTGVDVSPPLIEAARRRAHEAAPGNARFVLGDAQTHAFEPDAFDALVSRFGVMFFADPVAAFANLHRAIRPEGTLAFVAWRSPRENPFMTEAARAAAPFLPALAPPDPAAPGQWAFADPSRVRGILEASGWRDVAIEPVDVPSSVAVADLDEYLARLGPVGVALQDADDATRSRVTAAVRAAFDRYVEGDIARFTAACWRVTSRRG
jgi:SAM-dependent methyltransferase